MALERLVLLSVIVACVIDLVMSRMAARSSPDPVAIVLVAGGPPYAVEGVVRYLHWEFAVRNRLDTEIAVETRSENAECRRIVERLEADGFLVERVSGEPSLVFVMDADIAAAG